MGLLQLEDILLKSLLQGGASFSRASFSGGTDFLGASFSGERTDFSLAHFSGEKTDFREADFRGNWTDFRGAQFTSSEETIFSGAQFSGERTDFRRVEFGSAETYFRDAAFTGVVDFGEAIFREKVAFSGTVGNPVFDSQAWVWFRRSRIEKPEVATFDSVVLHISWFLNTDVRKFSFTDVMWYGLPGGRPGGPDDEIRALKERAVEWPHAQLAKICESLALLAEKNGDYEMAGEFYYWSMDVARKESRWRFGLLNNLYWALSGYGERILRAFGILVAICAVFAVLYMFAGPSKLQVLHTSGFSESIQHAGHAMVYSLGVLFRLSPDPKPDLGLFQLLVTIESIMGPVQIAVLLLAIRRKILRQRIFQ
jgi:hypothetical protein